MVQRSSHGELFLAGSAALAGALWLAVGLTACAGDPAPRSALDAGGVRLSPDAALPPGPSVADAAPTRLSDLGGAPDLPKASPDAAPTDLVIAPDAPAPQDSAVSSDTAPTADLASDSSNIPAPPAFSALLAALSDSSDTLDSLMAGYEMPICKDGSCLMVTAASNATTVEVLGDFNAWEPGTLLTLAGDGWFWTLVTVSPAPRWDYKLKRDGQWQLDPTNLYFSFGPFGRNSAIYAPGRGRLRALDNVSSSALPEPRSLYVYLPAAYFEQPSQSFPVLLMQDGFNVFQNPAAPFGAWDADVTADALMGSGQAAPVILCGIDTHDRLAEYTYTAYDVPDLGDVVPKLDLYLSLITETVWPLLAQTFRTNGDVGVVGSSLGGLSALYMAWEAPALFSKVGSLSGSFWVGEASQNAMRHRIAAAQSPSTGLRVYLDSGDTSSDGIASYAGDGWFGTDWTRNALIRRGWDNQSVWDTDADLASAPADLPAETPMAQVPALSFDPELSVSPQQGLLSVVGHGHQHNEAAWKQRFALVLRFLFPAP